jgi:nicotinamidase-related amidase
MEKDSGEAININPARTALLLMHWQNDLVMPSGKIAGDMPKRLAAARTIEKTQAVLKATREKGMLAVYVNGSHRPGYPELSPRLSGLASGVAKAGALVRGSWGAEVIDELKPLAEDIIIYNFNPSAFAYTELDLILHNKGITDLVLSGLVTNWVVETTARDAANRGYYVYTLRDCCQGVNDEMHNWSLSNILSAVGTVIDSRAYIASLQGIPQL